MRVYTFHRTAHEVACLKIKGLLCISAVGRKKALSVFYMISCRVATKRVIFNKTPCFEELVHLSSAMLKQHCAF